MQVLIFSQFKIMLDVLEDYLRLKGFPLERIDGSVAQRDREAAIDRYSAGAGHARTAHFAFADYTASSCQPFHSTAIKTWRPLQQLDFVRAFPCLWTSFKQTQVSSLRLGAAIQGLRVSVEGLQRIAWHLLLVLLHTTASLHGPSKSM